MHEKRFNPTQPVQAAYRCLARLRQSDGHTVGSVGYPGLALHMAVGCPEERRKDSQEVVALSAVRAT